MIIIALKDLLLHLWNSLCDKPETVFYTEPATLIDERTSGGRTGKAERAYRHMRDK